MGKKAVGWLRNTRNLLWNPCSWQLSMETFQKTLWYLWKGQNAAELLQLHCPGRWEVEKVWHRDAGAPGILWTWITCYFYASAVCVQVRGWCLMDQGIGMKNYRSAINQCPCESRFSSMCAGVQTVESLCKQSSRPSGWREGLGYGPNYNL